MSAYKFNQVDALYEENCKRCHCVEGGTLCLSMQGTCSEGIEGYFTPDDVTLPVYGPATVDIPSLEVEEVLDSKVTIGHPEVETALDTQVGGGHYKNLAIQPVEFCQRNKLNHCESSIVKYACRHKEKNGVEDIKKIIHYAQLILELEYGGS